ncbi:MAG: flagellar hook-basal body complex protein [Novosphingobium sp.]|nr:flagellar hook-basal body complex protein [Novosphingobium sp.]
MSFYTSLSGLKNAQTDLNTVAHNIANAETTGFKKSQASFADIVAGSAYANPRLTVGVGSTVESITQNFSGGPIEQTGAALDVAVNGSGFFTMKSGTTGDVVYTRNGAFTMDDGGYIQDGSNNRLQIFAPGDDPATAATMDAQVAPVNGAGAAYTGTSIGTDGTVTATYADGTNTVLGRVALASFIAPAGLRQLGSANWAATGISGAASYGVPESGSYGGLLSGALERSNVDISEELVGLITAQRYFQANAKAIDTATQISQTIINLRT